MKYRNHKTLAFGIEFDSQKEANRYVDLVVLQGAGKIHNLKLQVPFELIPKQDGERAVKYIADFVYEQDGHTVVEDVKSPATRKDKAYILKRKLMLFRHGIKIVEV